MRKNKHKSGNANKYENHTSCMPDIIPFYFSPLTHLLLMQGASVFYEFIPLVYAFLDETPTGTKGL